MEWIERLRRQTRQLHQTAHALPFFQALWGKTLPLESLVGQLRCLAVVYGALEKQLATRSSRDPFQALLNGHQPKLPLLLRDLEPFSRPAVWDILPAVEKALAAADQILTTSQENETALAGFFYTLEGSTLGARVMAPKIREAFPTLNAPGSHFFSVYGNGLSTRWTAFLRALGDAFTDPEDQENVIKASRDLFQSLIAFYDALYPFTEGKLGRHVVSLNPEAGNHPIPSDSLELEAALKAAERCWEAFPYFALRYGERGRRFADSDAAWLAALCDLDGGTLLEQVRWLSELLSVRGMPTWLLETQIRFLHEELCHARPDQRVRFDRLLVAADALRSLRWAAPDQESLNRIVHKLRERFPVPPDSPWTAVFVVLAAAAADRDSGIAGGPENICEWIRATYPEDLSVIDAVEAFFREPLWKRF